VYVLRLDEGFDELSSSRIETLHVIDDQRAARRHGRQERSDGAVGVGCQARDDAAGIRRGKSEGNQ
jgi:hypothetical protein